MASKEGLAKDAIHIEQNLIRENVGSQDQVSAAFGGFNRIDLHRDGGFSVSPIVLQVGRKRDLRDHLMLFFTGVSRFASDVARSQIDNLHNRRDELSRMSEMVDEAIAILQNMDRPIDDFGRLLDAGWRCKRSLSDKISSPEIDALYNAAMEEGAIGGKILGAGGGGFLLIFAKPERQAAIRARLGKLVHVPFDFEDSGSRVVLYQPNGL